MFTNFMVGSRIYVALAAKPSPPWYGNRFRFGFHHEPVGYTAGFANPNVGIMAELCGWEFSIGIEYG